MGGVGEMSLSQSSQQHLSATTGVARINPRLPAAIPTRSQEFIVVIVVGVIVIGVRVVLVTGREG